MDRPLTVGIRHPLILKDSDLALLTDPDGGIPRPVAGLGLFFRDTCYLAGYELRLHDAAPLLLTASDELGAAARLSLTNPPLETANGGRIDTHKVSIERTLRLEDGRRLTDTIELRNACEERICLPLSLEFSTVFESIFALRGAKGLSRGELHAPEWDGERLRFAYDGADHVRRILEVAFSHPAAIGARTSEQTLAFFRFDLASGERDTLVVSITVAEEGAGDVEAAPPDSEIFRAAANDPGSGVSWPSGFARIDCSDGETGRLLRRSLADLDLLQVRRGEERFTAAGLPWFLALFGRDSLIPAIQALAFNPDLCEQALRALASRQARREVAATGEAPGKILHELRVGEAARLGEVIQTPSYVGIDATLLFLIALGRHASWSGDLALFQSLRGSVDAALGWLRRQEAANPLGYVAYDGTNAKGGPINQAWRDSDDGVLRADGALPVPPIAMVEVQGYTHQAKRLIAGLLRRVGDGEEAERLTSEADQLADRFERDFWMAEEACYCLGLEHGGRQIASVASNAAQVLWTGLPRADRAGLVAERVMREDMFSGWGVRTLSSDHPRFDPLAYQQGSIWPFDTSLIVSGLRRYGLDGPAMRLFEATLAAARRCAGGRLPEFFSGEQRRDGAAPAQVLRSDPLQAWSAGALPFMLTELLGLEPDGFEGRLIVRRPLLPAWIDRLRIEDLRLAGSVVSLEFRRDGSVVRVEAVGEGVEVQIEV